MKLDILPADFDGVFRFTNSSDQEFKARWGGIEYTFPAAKTIPLIIPGATPEEVQHIRKKFAGEWALNEFAKTDKFKKLNEHIPGGHPAPYTESDLAPFIAKCLEPLPLAQAAMRMIPKDNDNFRKDDDGHNVTTVIEGKSQGKLSLTGKGSAEIDA